jgi:general secretion pathway protein I
MSANKGFTLLEVMVAMVILSLAFVAVIFSINSSTRVLTHVREVTRAQWVASNTITRVQLGLLELSSNSVSGYEDQLGQNFYWNVKVDRTDNAKVSKLIVTVSTTENGPSVLTTYAFAGAKK